MHIHACAYMRLCAHVHAHLCVCMHGTGLAQISSHVMEELRDSVGSDTELLQVLLHAPWLQALLKVSESVEHSHVTQYITLYALLSVHDVVGLKDYEPVLPPLPETLPVDGEAMRIICLVKNNQPLGATIRRDERTGEIYVARVIHGGLADRSGLLYAGDRLVEVNGHAVFGLEPEQIIHILVQSQGAVTFKVVPIADRPVNTQSMLYVRALVHYNPWQDPAIPCAHAGLAFRKGDLLEIVDQTDALWWQARKLPCSATCAGLVPSANLLKRKQREFWWSQPKSHTCSQAREYTDDIMTIDVNFTEPWIFGFCSGFQRSLRLCRRRGAQGRGLFGSACGQGSFYNTLAGPYEEVVLYQRPPEDRHRLIALLGPSGVGVNELRRRLIEISPQTYQGATPHTTRTPRGHELPGREYHFVSRDQFKNMLYSNRFLEYGEYRRHLYGTTVEAVKAVLASGKICVIDIEPYAIESVRTRELRAYIIYIKPPPLDQLKQTRTNSQLITGSYTSQLYKDEDFQKIVEAGRWMEQQYRQFFDCIIVNGGLQASCVRLLMAVRRAQEEPHWVPASWIRPTP
uniref:MAGUK p55 scaffold protein 4b n=1 Tax=Electrophorus electricus TaxID=8005 RepID=A0A4W4F259_ELEEL